MDGLETQMELASMSSISRFAVRRLTLTNFRCYEYLRLDIDSIAVVLSGPNGVGKTNILEALSMLVPGRGLRGAKLSEISRKPAIEEQTSGPSAWGVAARLSGFGDPIDIGTGYQPPWNGGVDRRTVRIDGEIERSQQALTNFMRLHWLTPQMDRLFQEGAAKRRQFLDRLVSIWDPAHVGRISAYERAMRERLKLLRSQPSPDPAWLLALEDNMASRGVAIAAARADLVTRLAPVAAKSWGPFPGALLALEGDVHDWLSKGPALEAEESFRVVLGADRERDGTLGQTHAGPQRTDVLVRHALKGDPAGRCSTGEQKAMLIALVLANVRIFTCEYGEAPVLLLDEVGAHLDQERREVLFTEILSLAGQVWFTGTDPNIFSGLKGVAQFCALENGAVMHEISSNMVTF